MKCKHKWWWAGGTVSRSYTDGTVITCPIYTCSLCGKKKLYNEQGMWEYLQPSFPVEEVKVYIRKEQRCHGPTRRSSSTYYQVWAMYTGWDEFRHEPYFLHDEYKIVNHNDGLQRAQKEFTKDYTEGKDYVEDSECGSWVPVFKWVMLDPLPDYC